MMDKEQEKRLIEMFVKIDRAIAKARKKAYLMRMANLQIAYGFDRLFSLN